MSSLDTMLPSCSTASQLLDQLSAHLAAASASGSSGPMSSSSIHPPSPPPGRVHYHQRATHNNANAKKYDSTNEFRCVQNAIAMAVLVRLHRWCCQLFWLTIVCLIGYCSDQQRRDEKNGTVGSTIGISGADQQGRRTFQEVRKSIVQATQRRGCKTVTELEMQLLRHLTCPQTAVLRPLRPSQHKKRHFLSRPPSPQLFDISEENEQ